MDVLGRLSFNDEVSEGVCTVLDLLHSQICDLFLLLSVLGTQSHKACRYKVQGGTGIEPSSMKERFSSLWGDMSFKLPSKYKKQSLAMIMIKNFSTCPCFVYFGFGTTLGFAFLTVASLFMTLDISSIQLVSSRSDPSSTNFLLNLPIRPAAPDSSSIDLSLGFPVFQ